MIEKLFKENLKKFKPYVVSKTKYEIKLDANESFLTLKEKTMEKILNKIKNIDFNRYPDADSEKVRRLYGEYAGVNIENMIAGNGSDELIQIIVSALVDKDEKIMMLNPDFSMYKNYTEIVGGKALVYELNDEFNLDVDKIIKNANEENVKVLFISNPNNPTGKIIKRDDILKILEECKCVVVIDEAYFEFYGETVVDKINEYRNLIVLRTCSKAMAMAAIRLGFLIANKCVLSEIKKVKPPFNVNSVTQAIGEAILEDKEVIKKSIDNIIEEREFLTNGLKKIESINMYPTYANFILIKFNNAKKVYEILLEKGIIVRNFGDGRLKNCLRITVGSRKENEKLIDILNEIL